MFPQNYRDRYQKFQEILEVLQQRSVEEPVDSVKLQNIFARVRQIFQSEIASLSGDDLDPPTASRMQSYLTEINKQLRLLEVDFTFLQAARQPATVKTRLAQINTRLQTLIGYSQAVLAG
ncbi:MAG TPA: heterocyst frequency control protein PatD [Leptolyngbyaceae cyanobacterium]